jgi:hypothetical protein
MCVAVGFQSETSTTNGGISWTTPQTIPGANLVTVDCPSASDCYAVGEDGGFIDATTDGGASWNSETLPSGAGDLSGLTCTSTREIVKTCGWESDGLRGDLLAQLL